MATLPGARIVCPSFADDAAGLLRTSMRSRGFTLFLEPKALYNSVDAATVVPEDFEVPFGKARIRREGSDLSIITYGNTTHFCLNVAESLEKEGRWSVEVIDIRSLIPLDKETIYESVKKTSKALVVQDVYKRQVLVNEHAVFQKLITRYGTQRKVACLIFQV